MYHATCTPEEIPFEYIYPANANSIFSSKISSTLSPSSTLFNGSDQSLLADGFGFSAVGVCARGTIKVPIECSVSADSYVHELVLKLITQYRVPPFAIAGKFFLILME